MDPKRYRPSNVLAGYKRPSDLTDTHAQVYVGHICSKIADSTVLELLGLCGEVNKWLRQPDPLTGKMIHFGYCEFGSLEGVWRALELLDGRRLGSKSLVVRCDTRTQKLVDDYIYSSRTDTNKQRMIQATIDALITSANQNWRNAAESDRIPLGRLKPIKPIRASCVSARWRPSERETRRAKRRAEATVKETEILMKMLFDWEGSYESAFGKKTDVLDKERLIRRDALDPVTRPIGRDSERREDELDAINEQKEVEAFEAQLLEEEEKKESARQELKSRRHEDETLFNNLLALKDPRLEAAIELARKVPRTDVFSHKIDWQAIERENVFNLRLRPWLRLLMISVLGQEDDRLTNQILTKLAARTDPELMLPLLERAFDAQAEVIASRLFKLLIYESARLH